jgi:hypothetical protein
MKIIFSKKGFDSSYGGRPSPIFADGSMLSLPIADKNSQCPYAAIRPARPVTANMLDLLLALGCRHVRAGDKKIPLSEKTSAHLDPDLVYEQRPRRPGWCPAFGQSGAAMGHLRKQRVGPGDLFLFYGLFVEVAEAGPGSFIDAGKYKHVIWGWLQVEEVRSAAQIINDPAYRRLDGHPHLAPGRSAAERGYIFVSRPRLDLPGLTAFVPGAGVFGQLRPELILSDPDPAAPFSQWKLPAFFAPGPGKPAMSYFGSAQWSQQGESVIVKPQGGFRQEAVLEADSYKEDIMPWLRDLFGKCTQKKGM